MSLLKKENNFVVFETTSIIVSSSSYRSTLGDSPIKNNTS